MDIISLLDRFIVSMFSFLFLLSLRSVILTLWGKPLEVFFNSNNVITKFWKPNFEAMKAVGHCVKTEDSRATF